MENNIMTQEEKELVIKDILGRLPYGVFVKENRNSLDDGPVIYTYDYHPYISNCKPYLRPMSSMTEEEKEEYGDLDYIVRYATNSIYASEHLLVFCNSHHLDYHGLIERGLALEAPDGMYNKKSETI